MSDQFSNWERLQRDTLGVWAGAHHIAESLTRYSVGIEAAEDLIADLDQALALM